MRNWGVFWGLILILLGLLFLLSSLGILPWNVWAVFWPLALILFGLMMFFSAFGTRGPATIDNLAFQLKGFEEAQVSIKYGAGRLNIRGGAAPDELLNGSFEGGVEHDLGQEGERALVELRSPSALAPPFWSWQNREWNIHLNSDIPLKLKLDVGASESHIDLTGTQTRSIRLKTGASSHELLLPSASGETKVKVEGGAGSVRVTVPEDVAARISGKVDVGSLAIDQKRFPRGKGDNYQSIDFDQAVNRVDIRVKFGAGEVNVS